jgi:hypothetical protein
MKLYNSALNATGFEPTTERSSGSHIGITDGRELNSLKVQRTTTD